MGAWGTGSFQNDDAMDWVYELEESGVSFLKETLEAVTETPGEYVERPECANAIAAAEVIVSLQGVIPASLPPEVRQWVSAHRKAKAGKLVPLALQAVQRIRTDDDCESKVLWDESASRDEWYNALDDLEARLRNVAGSG
jgi:hypothetical protein